MSGNIDLIPLNDYVVFPYIPTVTVTYAIHLTVRCCRVVWFGLVLCFDLFPMTNNALMKVLFIRFFFS